MVVSLPTLLILGLCAFTIVLSSSIPTFGETNGRRLARGLPPSPPRFLRGIDARNRPTRVSGSRRTVTSPLPPVTLTGRLDVRSKDGSSLGHVRNWSGGGTIGGIAFDSSGSGDLLVSLTYYPSNPTQIDILATNPAFPAPFYVGAGSPSATIPKLASGSETSLSFTNVASTLPGSGPVASGGGYAESAIWTINPVTKQLTPHWVNADGSQPSTVFSYDIRNNRLFFTGDLTFYNTQSSFPSVAVDLFLVPT